MHEFEIKPELEKKLIKLSKKDKKAFETVMKKIDEIVNSYEVEHYKNLRHDMKESKRVHLGHFVLVFKYDKSMEFISFEDYDHHDKIYKLR
jgi:mRNA-degrading endonuclease RelE of RelBE toxin-antitoxin system